MAHMGIIKVCIGFINQTEKTMNYQSYGLRFLVWCHEVIKTSKWFRGLFRIIPKPPYILLASISRCLFFPITFSMLRKHP